MYHSRAPVEIDFSFTFSVVDTMLKRDLWDLCDNIGLIGLSANWSYVTASSSHNKDQAIPILSPLHVGHPYITVFKIRNFDLLITPPFINR